MSRILSPLKKTDPLSLTKADPIAVGGFSAEFGIGKCLRAQTFMRANTVASGEKEKARDVGFAQEAKNLETAGACAPRVTAPGKGLTTDPRTQSSRDVPGSCSNRGSPFLRDRCFSRVKYH